MSTPPDTQMAAEVPKEVVEAVAEVKLEAPKKDTWVGSLFKWMSYIFVFWIIVLGIQIAFSVYATWTFNAKKKNDSQNLNLHDLKKPGLDAVVFQPEDVSTFVPAPGAIQEIRSDRTTQDLLQGKQGPVVVLFSSDWCPHCKNMMPAQEQAAAKSDVPFVKVDGQQPTQTMKHFKVAGQPTIYGVDAESRVWPQATQRTTEEFLNFARKLKAKEPAKDSVKIEEIPEVKTETVHVAVEVLDEDHPQDAPAANTAPVDAKESAESQKAHTEVIPETSESTEA